MTAGPERGFLCIDGRRVHWRRWGAGPAVLVLHGSPQSSRAVAAQAGALAAAGLCAIAPDTPGNGLSEPLPAPEPDSGDFADALAAFADALGLGRVGLYGFHTGAATAAAFAARHPERTTAVAFEGLPLWTEAERASFAGYLPPFRPAWDGSHMAWLWARLEEQTVFFPWHAPTPDARMHYDVSSPAHLHANAIDLLDAGDAYRPAYAAALGFRAEDWLPRLRAPTLAAALETDVIAGHLDRQAAAGLERRRFAEPGALRAAAAAHLAAHPGDLAPAEAPATRGSQGFRRLFVGGLQARLRRVGRGRPLLLLHAAGGRLDDLGDLAAEADDRPVLALELPRHGESQAADAASLDSLARLAEALAAAADALGWPRDGDAVGLGVGGRVASALAASGRVAVASSRDAPDLHPRAAEAAGLPSLAPEWDGAHLVRAFRIARWERLFRPWFLRDRAHAIPQGDLDPVAVHARAVSLLKAQEAWPAAVRLVRT